MLPGLGEWLAAFWELSTDRQIGFTFGPIPAAAIARWADRAGMDADEAEMFRVCIRAMDRVLLDHHSRTARQKSGQPVEPKATGVTMTPGLFKALFSKPKG